MKNQTLENRREFIRLNVPQRKKNTMSYINHTDHVIEILLGKILISSHQFMSSSAIFVPFRDKNVLYFINI